MHGSPLPPNSPHGNLWGADVAGRRSRAQGAGGDACDSSLRVGEVFGPHQVGHLASEGDGSFKALALGAEQLPLLAQQEAMQDAIWVGPQEVSSSKLSAVPEPILGEVLPSRACALGCGVCDIV